jgi:hypothetical protein
MAAWYLFARKELIMRTRIEVVQDEIASLSRQMIIETSARSQHDKAFRSLTKRLASLEHQLVKLYQDAAQQRNEIEEMDADDVTPPLPIPPDFSNGQYVSQDAPDDFNSKDIKGRWVLTNDSKAVPESDPAQKLPSVRKRKS